MPNQRQTDHHFVSVIFISVSHVCNTVNNSIHSFTYFLILLVEVYIKTRDIGIHGIHRSFLSTVYLTLWTHNIDGNFFKRHIFYHVQHQIVLMEFRIEAYFCNCIR